MTSHRQQQERVFTQTVSSDKSRAQETPQFAISPNAATDTEKSRVAYFPSAEVFFGNLQNRVAKWKSSRLHPPLQRPAWPAGKFSANSFPMPAYCEPWPGKRKHCRFPIVRLQIVRYQPRCLIQHSKITNLRMPRFMPSIGNLQSTIGNVLPSHQHPTPRHSTTKRRHHYQVAIFHAPD